MIKRISYISWAVLYVVCMALSFVKADGYGKLLLSATGFIFFIPPFFFVYRAHKEDNQRVLRSFRLLCILVLAISLVLLVLNFLSVYFSAHTGLVLYVLLAMFSTPMLCIQYWAVGLFLWACLLMVTLIRFIPSENSPDQR